MRKILLLFVLTLPIIGISQNYGDKNFYLVDSLDLSLLSENDIHYLDSILTLIKNEKIDTVRLDLLGKIVGNIWNENVWPKYNLYVLDYCNNLLKQKNIDDHTKETALIQKSSALGNIGYLYDLQGVPLKAIDFYKKGLVIQQKINIKDKVAISLGNIGYVYKSMGQIETALNYYNKALQINQRIKDKKGIAYMLNNIGMIFYNQNEFEPAIDYFQRSLKIEIKLNDTYSIGNSYNNIASLFIRNEQYDSAIYYYNKGFELHKSIGNTEGMGNSCSNLATTYLTLKNYKKALQQLNLAEAYFLKLNSIKIAGLYNEKSEYYYKTKKLRKAKKYGLMGLYKARKANSKPFIKDASHILNLIYKKSGNYKEALKMYELYINTKDSLLNNDTKRAAIRQNLQYEFEKEALKDSLAFEEQQKIELLRHNHEVKQQKSYTYFSITGFLVMLLLAGVIFRGYSRKKKNNTILQEKNATIIQQKEKVESQHSQLIEQHQEITDSINYAKRIQTALLTEDAEWEKISPEYFVFFKPKDVVSGDFFWAYFNKTKELAIWVAADCTGHGVPGAFMSMLGIGFLNEIIIENSTTNPAEILNSLREKIINSLEQKNIDTKQKDGMDLALCVWNKKTNTLEYSGANNPLWIVRDKKHITKEQLKERGTYMLDEKDIGLVEFKPDKQPVGFYREKEDRIPFTSTKIQLQKEDTIYTFSDGYPDQFGGPKGKKLKYRPFKMLLLENNHQPLTEQKELLRNYFKTWKGGLEQIDDVCIIGIKVN